MKVFEIAPVKYIDNKMLVLDQTRLPGEEVYEEMHTKEDVWEAIYKLKVRGAPAIGVAAAYGLYLSVRDFRGTDIDDFAVQLKDAKDYLVTARPTAVNLAWALTRMWDKFEALGRVDVAAAKSAPSLTKQKQFAERTRRRAFCHGRIRAVAAQTRHGNSDSLQCGNYCDGQVWNLSCAYLLRAGEGL